MFCTKCGKELYEGDRFCAHCGAAVREPKHAGYEDVVFNPPFKLEAEKRTEEILKAAESPKTSAGSRQTVSFDWNLEGFPSSQPRKTEAVDFNWDSVLEKRRNVREVSVEKIEPEPENEPMLPGESEPLPEFAEQSYAQETDFEEPALSIEELEKELFGIADEEQGSKGDIEHTIVAEAGTWNKNAADRVSGEIPSHAPMGDERFYTYNQKFDAFQELLDKERERLKGLEELKLEELKSEEPNPEESIHEELKPLELVSVAAPAATMTVDLSGDDRTSSKADPGEGNPEGEGSEASKTSETSPSSPSKSKLRYSDVFPRGLVNDDGTGPDDSAETDEEVKREIKPLADIYDASEDEEETKKLHTLAKVIIALLIILIIVEGSILAIKFIAPDSKISLWANDMMLKAVNFLTGDDGEKTGAQDDTTQSSDNEKEVYMSGLVESASKDMNTIGEAVFAPELKYNMLKDYGFEEISEAESFVDADWQEDAEGNGITYGRKLAEALINFYDGWQSSNTDESLVGINKLEIGEIRTGKEGFYALCRVTYAASDGKDVVKYQTVFLKISGNNMVINEIKEDKL